MKHKSFSICKVIKNIVEKGHGACSLGVSAVDYRIKDHSRQRNRWMSGLQGGEG